MLSFLLLKFGIACLLTNTFAYNYDPAWTQYNLNMNRYAQHPLEYSGEWDGHTYTPSPRNWRFPFYTLFLDRFVNGDPTNDNINGTLFEHDLNSNQMRHGGDLQGFIDSLDYLQGMGVKGVYIAGSPFINQPWAYDSYSPLDLTILDWHFGDINKWREAVNAAHEHGMYVILDSTFATLGDLLGFKGHLNSSTPFTFKEYEVLWKSQRKYWDFEISDKYNDTCEYPRFWQETGYPVDRNVTEQMKGCYDSDFDQYGDTEAFGVYPDWRRQLTKFASVQDRLREWHEPVRLKLQNFYCMMIGQLDIDGFRYDKAMQSTVDAMGHMNAAMRRCARKYGKENFFLPGEITGGNAGGSIYIGRGRQPDMKPENLKIAASLTNETSDPYSIQEAGIEGLDAAAFHYTTYRSLTRFLGMDGNLEAGYDSPNNWVDQWNDFILTNDLVNANTGQWDPRHMYGVTNQDVFRWPAIHQGVQRQLLGHFITTLLLPGIPLLLWGEEQAFYLLDSTASNYIFGRQPMSSANAWMRHGCYSLNKLPTQYYQMPIDEAIRGCYDETQMHDHRDPTHPVRNILRHMFYLRNVYPVLNDGLYLQQLSNQTEDITYPGSSGVATEVGLWSVLRSQFPGVQDLSQAGGQGDVSVWLLYSNRNHSTVYNFECNNNGSHLNTTALIAPYASGTTVKNLFHPYDEFVLGTSVKRLGLDGSPAANGCIASLKMAPYGFKAYVPVTRWMGPKPMLTKFVPGHDARIESSVGPDEAQELDVEFQFSQQMNCDSLADNISFNSTTLSGEVPSIKLSSVTCSPITPNVTSQLVGYSPSKWSYKATLMGVRHGVHAITIRPLWSSDGVGNTNATEKVVFRIGSIDNPVVFPLLANYSDTLLKDDGYGGLVLHQKAAGASLWRYSTNWGSTFSNWTAYDGIDSKIERQSWHGTERQRWEGDHVRVEYYSPLVGQSDIVQQADAGIKSGPRRFPHLFWNGPYNQYGYDAGLDNAMTLTENGTWEHHLMAEWRQAPHGVLGQINVWGMNPDGRPDQSFVFGDINQDSILDRLPPSSLSESTITIAKYPPLPYLGWKITLNDGTMGFALEPSGNMWPQIILFVLMGTIPVLSACVAVWIYMQSFYDIKFNQVGNTEKSSFVPTAVKYVIGKEHRGTPTRQKLTGQTQTSFWGGLAYSRNKPTFLQATGNLISTHERKMILIATMEYDIEDWDIRIKIGGLGVMAQLMGKNLGHQHLIWVVPCVGGVDYPEDSPAEPMQVMIMGETYEIKVQTHQLRNITYVLLDAPIFRQQTKAEPYPPRMDDINSAIYYSAWNQCIAHTINRFPIDLYHINDYHGSVAPLYLLPRTIPCCLSLHNAEFQGLFPMRTKEEVEEICSVFNLPIPIAQQYVQFGDIFNLLHAGASILREHQGGFGAVGVSRKYGKRSFARYPIFWGLKKVGQLPNPDPSDTGPWDKKLPKESDITVDWEYEAGRAESRRQAQEWAGLEQNPDAELFVFVGRWSLQKGIDLIADVFPIVLEANPNVQLIAVGPIIDLYGKFAAAKLDKMMKIYPGRVFSNPVFTNIPPCIFSGAEFALIPSRDEPFGLVAVESGRKGALGVGSRVGGLGQMPGWWFTIESMSASHLSHQFREAIQEALACKKKTRALMRARSAKQRFPVVQWIEDLEILQSTAIKIHEKVQTGYRNASIVGELDIGPPTPSEQHTPSYYGSAPLTPTIMPRRRSTLSLTTLNSRLSIVKTHQDQGKLKKRRTPGSIEPQRRVFLGSRSGPGHVQADDDEVIGRVTQVAPNLPPIVILDDCDDIDFLHIGEAVTTDDMSFVSDSEEEDVTDIYKNLRSRRSLPGKIDKRRSLAPVYDNEDLPVPPSAMAVRAYPPDTDPAPTRLSARDSGVALSIAGTPRLGPENSLLRPPPALQRTHAALRRATPSMLSVDIVVGEKKDYHLQRVDPFFTDSTEEYYREFEQKLNSLNGRNSELTCIETFLIKSEKRWFDSVRNAKLGRLQDRRSSVQRSLELPGTFSRKTSRTASMLQEGEHSPQDTNFTNDSPVRDEFVLPSHYEPPTGLLKFMQLRCLDWPVYSFFLAFGQIIAANSYQITLLTGEVGQPASKLYVIASVYLITSVCWWIMFRRLPSRFCLSLPFAFYGLAFIFVAVAHYGHGNTKGWIQNIGTVWYAVASSSGSIFFALNFVDEAGTQTRTWIFRACIIQGMQQIYVVALWAWGSYLSKRNTQGLLASDPVTPSWPIIAICIPIAVALWVVGIIVFLGLPNYYRQSPASIPSFYTSITRRKIILWFFVTVLVQNFFLSAPYSRNWEFLFSSSAAPTIAVILLVLLFFVGVWSGFLGIFAWLSESHSWILPLFAIGLGAPRWAQIWWGTSNIGIYLPWAPGHSPVFSALLSRSLWLWLGTLDSIQGVGLGMILLVTLTRAHVAFTLIAAQILGSIATMVARACAPNRIGPGPISPDISKGIGEIWQAWFWVGLIANLSLCVGFFVFFRKEQLCKP